MVGDFFVSINYYAPFMILLSANDTNETNSIRTQTYKENKNYNNDKLLNLSGMKSLSLLC